MRTKVIKLLLKKELLDVFRDRKAIVMLVLVPLLIYPLIFFGSFAVMTMIQSNMEKGEYDVIVEADDDGNLVRQIDIYNKEKKKENEKKSDDSAITQNDSGSTDSLSIVSYQEAINRYNNSDNKSEDTYVTGSNHLDNIDALLQAEIIDVYVSAKKDKNGKLIYSTRCVSSITDSDYAENLIKDVLDELTEEKTKEAITEGGLDAESIMNPFEIKREDIASQEQSIGSVLGMILPFMLIISLLMGTMYPAIDATAGEKERGTLETLLTLPVKNHEIIIAKFLTVAFMGIVSAFLNMISMAVMILYVVKLMSAEIAGNMGFNLKNFHVATFMPAMIVTVLAVLAFSLFISAVTMCIAAFAKSYKEANNYITPLTLVVMLTGYIGFIPNIELTRNMALCPVANICLMIKELLLFRAEMHSVILVLVSNIVYAIVAIILLSKIYDSESVLFDEGRFGLQLFQKRSNMIKGGTPTPGDAWFIILFVFIVYLFAGSLLQIEHGIMGVFGSQLIILIIPLAFVIYTKRSIKETYKFNGFKITDVAASGLMYVGALIFESIVSSLINMFFPEQVNATNTGLEKTLVGDNVLVSILIVAVAPAICEEMLFRGFIQSGFSRKYKPAATIFLVSIFFGAYHTSLVKLIPTAMLGGCFAIVLYYTESIFLTMILHFTNNALAVLMMYYPGFFERTFPILTSAEMNVFESLIVATIGIIIVTAGFLTFRTPATVQKKAKKKKSEES